MKINLKNNTLNIKAGDIIHSNDSDYTYMICKDNTSGDYKTICLNDGTIGKGYKNCADIIHNIFRSADITILKNEEIVISRDY